MGQVKNIKEVFDSPIAQQMILEETIEGHLTKRVRSIAFEINDSYHL